MGVVGYIDFHGDLDMAIAIRTAVLKDGRAHVQAGAGIVADSIPPASTASASRKQPPHCVRWRPPRP